MTQATAAWSDANRLGGLRRFAVAITALNVVGHTLLGFEQSPAHPLVALAVAYGMELVLEWVGARLERRTPRFVGGPRVLVDFLLSAHITGMAVAMLLYANERLLPVAMAAACAIGSKAIVRVRVDGSSRHFLNPSNLGISVTLLAFPWVGIAPPYQFTENVSGAWDWALPGFIVILGTFLNARYTRRLPLIAAWLGGFVLQAALRSVAFDTPLAAALMPMTGLAFLLFTFYMVTDPATTPGTPSAQVIFGLGVALAYAILMMAHVVFGLFFSLSIVCLVRGIIIHAQNALRTTPVPAPSSTEARCARSDRPAALPSPWSGWPAGIPMRRHRPSSGRP
jgi:Na+-translocating ferredoxin:NAD+ oxidoreductase RnfD subunit